MTITQLSTLTNSLKVQRTNDYQTGGMRRRLYDILAAPIDKTSGAAGQANAMADLCKGGTVTLTYVSDMAIGTTPLSEVQDIVPQVLDDATKDITVNMYGDGIQTSQKALIEHFTNYDSRSPAAVGLNMMEVVDFLAVKAALAGTLFYRNPSARTSLDAGTTAHRASETIFANVAARLSQFNTPGWEGENKAPSWTGITDHFVLNDIAAGGNVVNVAIYQDKEMILNSEVGKLHSFKILASGWAKILNGAGVEGHTLNTTLSAAATRLSTTVNLTSTTNLAVGYWLNIGTPETSTTFYPGNERVKIASISSKVATIVGEGENGGLRFAHDSGTTCNIKDSVHLIMFGGPVSLAKVYAPVIGEFGELVGPKQQGLAEQWTSYAWKWFGGYGIPAENALYRAEVSVSEEA